MEGISLPSSPLPARWDLFHHSSPSAPSMLLLSNRSKTAFWIISLPAPQTDVSEVSIFVPLTYILSSFAEKPPVEA